jgi:hypothetical protein
VQDLCLKVEAMQELPGSVSVWAGDQINIVD